LTHGSETTQKCIFQTAVLFPPPTISADGEKRLEYDSRSLLSAFRGDKEFYRKIERNVIIDLSLARLLRDINLVDSISLFTSNITNRIGEGARVIKRGEVSINGIQQRIEEKYDFKGMLLDQGLLVIRRGKSGFKLVQVHDDEL
jgi:tyrosyl-tRNA synthetase